MRTEGEYVTCKPGREVSPGIEPAGTLMLGFRPPEPRETDVCLFVSRSLCFVTAAGADKCVRGSQPRDPALRTAAAAGAVGPGAQGQRAWRWGGQDKRDEGSATGEQEGARSPGGDHAALRPRCCQCFGRVASLLTLWIRPGLTKLGSTLPSRSFPASQPPFSFPLPYHYVLI